MARPQDHDLERLWRKRLRRHGAGSLSVTAFCAREGVSLASFYYWKRRLAAPSPSASHPAAPSPSASRPAASSPARPASGHPELFVPVRVQEPPRDHGSAPTRGVVLELPHRVRIRLDAPPEPEWLGRLVAAIAALPEREATP